MRAPEALRRCAFCLGALANGKATCSDACEAGWSRIVPPLPLCHVEALAKPAVRPGLTPVGKAAWAAKMVNAQRQRAAKERLGL